MGPSVKYTTDEIEKERETDSIEGRRKEGDVICFGKIASFMSLSVEKRDGFDLIF